MIHIVTDNPNPHGTTLCGTEDCHGPYVVFSAHELDDIMNPHPVICAHHLETDIVPEVELKQAEQDFTEPADEEVREAVLEI